MRPEETLIWAFVVIGLIIVASLICGLIVDTVEYVKDKKKDVK